MNITKDRVVSISYTLRDDKNKFIDSTDEGDFLDYLHGHENIIPGLERALEGRETGDRLTVSVPAADAYGERDEKLVSQISLDRFEGVESVEEGMQFEAQTPEGYRIVTVTGIEGDNVTIDANHPLAGMNLCFDVTVASIREAQPDELLHGHIHGTHPCGGEHEYGCCDGCGGCSG
ncbi:MAG: peptidylprolyl isomerase [Treponema sp.]|jgi:FKBP-type peptidyl-prolyl cis-trans isomerase SlyD|nr:peptidylprolyl isomerase [Treponema sp.]